MQSRAAAGTILSFKKENEECHNEIKELKEQIQDQQEYEDMVSQLAKKLHVRKKIPGDAPAIAEAPHSQLL